MKLGHFVRKASRGSVIEGIKHLKRYYIPQNKLLGVTNPLSTNCIEAVQRHTNATKSFIIPQIQIQNYLAASSLSHLLDGWMYLSDSFGALLNGDEGVSIHLSYYAELRSAMSILAAEGIGVFNGKHIGVFSSSINSEFPTNYFKAGGSYKEPQRPTHKFVWEAMEKWTSSTIKPETEILKIFKVKGRNFDELTEYFHPQATTVLSTAIVKPWLKEWCLDIKSYKEDRENRNVVSYRPQRIEQFDHRVNFQEIIDSLNKYWTVISPSSTDKFRLLDIYLLRKLFRKLYDEIRTTEPFRDLVENAFRQLGLYDHTIIDLLCVDPPLLDHTIFIKAQQRERTPLSIIARATLLLRVAVGLVSQLYQSGGVTKVDLDFVWENYGVNNGFWQQGNKPVDFDQLWMDIEQSIDDLNVDVNSPGNNNDLYAIRDRRSQELSDFTQISRACLWGCNF